MGEAKDSAYVDVLQDMLHRETDPGILSFMIRGLHLLDVPALSESPERELLREHLAQEVKGRIEATARSSTGQGGIRHVHHLAFLPLTST